MVAFQSFYRVSRSHLKFFIESDGRASNLLSNTETRKCFLRQRRNQRQHKKFAVRFLLNLASVWYRKVN